MSSTARPISLPSPAKHMRRNLPPSTGSKSMPGASATPASSSSRAAKPSESSVQRTDVGVDVEGAVGGGELVQPDRRAARREAWRGSRHTGRRSRPARRRRRRPRPRRSATSAGGQIVKLPASRSTASTQVVRDEQPADPPARHREVLAEGVHDHRAAAGLPRASRGSAVGDAVIDLVADQPRAVARRTRSRSRPARSATSIVPVGFAGLASDQARRRLRQRLQLGDGRLEARPGPARELDARGSRARRACCGRRGSRGGP